MVMTHSLTSPCRGRILRPSSKPGTKIVPPQKFRFPLSREAGSFPYNLETLRPGFNHGNEDRPPTISGFLQMEPIVRLYSMAQPPRVPVLLPNDHTVVYFITWCVAGRKAVLDSPLVWQAFQRATNRLSDWVTLAAVLMPDHLHVLAAPRDRAFSPGAYSAAIKRWMRADLSPPWSWQRGCFDRLLRSNESAAGKWHYVRENPVRAGLVARWEDWPYRMGFESDG